MTYRTTVGAVALVIGLGASGAETHSAHEHGHAVLKLVQEGTEVVVHFESPLDSIVGFEHEPENDEQRAALEEAMRIVRVSENIVRLPDHCTSTGEPEVHVPYVADDYGDHDDHHGEDHGDDHGDHADHHGEDHGDDHGDHADHHGEDHGDHHDAADEQSEAAHDDHEATGEHGDHHHADEEGEVHADLEATFKFGCESSLEWLEATAFATFGALEEIELQAVGPDGAVVETLTAASPRAVLTGS